MKIFESFKSKINEDSQITTKRLFGEEIVYSYSDDNHFIIALDTGKAYGDSHVSRLQFRNKNGKCKLVPSDKSKLSKSKIDSYTNEVERLIKKEKLQKYDSVFVIQEFD